VKVARLILSVAFVCVLFVVGYGWRDFQKGQSPTGETLRGIIGGKPTRKADSPSKVFRDAYTHILNDYQKPLDREKLRYAGMSGMMASLGDPHTMFMEPKSSEEFKLETRATFAGVGARLAPDPLGARVAVVFEEGPAARAGMKSGDIITGVNDKPVGGWDVDKIVDQVRGPEGTSVSLTLMRDGAPAPISIKIKRAKITVPTVTSKKLPNSDYGYLEVSTFSEPTPDQFIRAVESLERQRIKGLIIDLRGNPGGLLESATEMLSYFADNKPVVVMKMRNGRAEKEVTFSGLKRNWTYPIVLLVNEESASAAEIMAGVLKDYGMATLVGEHTYGKASVQTMFSLVDGSSAKVTIARYYLPNGGDIGRKVDDDGGFVSGGLPVDVEVKLQDQPTPIVGDPATDNQLSKAMEVLDGKRGSSASKPRPAEPAITMAGYRLVTV